MSAKTRKAARRRRSVHHVTPRSRARRQDRLAKSANHSSAAAMALAYGSRDMATIALDAAQRATRWATVCGAGVIAQTIVILALIIWR